MDVHSGRFLVVLVLVCSLLTRTAFIPLSVAYSATSIALVAVLGAVYVDDNLEIVTNKTALALLVVIFAVYLFNILLGAPGGQNSVYSVVKVISFLLFTTTAIFFAPMLVNSEDFLWIVSWLGAAVVIVGLPTAVIGSYSILGFRVTSHIWGFNLPIPFVPNDAISPITSVMDNPNIFGYLASVGFASSIVGVRRRPGKVVLWLLAVVNFLGAYLSGSRTALLVSLIAGGVIVTYLIFGSHVTAFVVFGTCASVVYFVAVNFGLLPGPSLLQVDLRSREYLWRTTWRAVKTRPVLGFGAGHQTEFIEPFLAPGQEQQPPHNSYLRMFLNTGLVGGLAYIVLTTHVLVRSFKHTPKPGMTIIATVIVLHQFFAGFSIFGLAFNSILAAIVFGYILRPGAEM